MKKIMSLFLVPALAAICWAASVNLYHSPALEIGSDGASPTASSCGSSPSVTGNDNAAKVTPGTGVITSCTVSFGSSFTNEPHCAISCKDSVNCELEVSNTGYITVDFVTKPAYIQYICLGHR